MVAHVQQAGTALEDWSHALVGSSPAPATALQAAGRPGLHGTYRSRFVSCVPNAFRTFLLLGSEAEYVPDTCADFGAFRCSCCQLIETCIRYTNFQRPALDQLTNID
jgi:hypothetical protein